MPAKNKNTAANKNQTNAVDKTSEKNVQTMPKSDNQSALTKAAASLQAAINQGNAYINSAAFSKMTAEKQTELRTSIQTGKELLNKYNAMQTATNAAGLDVDLSKYNQVLIFTAQSNLVDKLQVKPLTFTKGNQNV